MRVQAFDYSIDLLQAILWQYNDAVKLQSLLEQKQTWYDEQYSEFWEAWYRDVFDLRTANDFGLSVWAILLNIPLTITSGQEPSSNIWGFGPYPTFTRASSGSYFNNAGLLVTAGNDVPRYAYDPTTLQYAGLVYEAAATNITTYSQTLNNAAWPGSQMFAVTADQTAAPDGTTTAELLVPNGTMTNHYIDNTAGGAGLADGAIVSVGVFVKKKDFGRAMLGYVVKNGSGPTLEFRFADERITVSAQGTGNTGVTFSVVKLPNDWYLLKMENINVQTGATTPRPRIFLSDDVGVGYALWGKLAATGARDVIASPVSGWTGDSLVEDGTTASHGAQLSFNWRTGKPQVATVYFKELAVGAKRYIGLTIATGAIFPGANHGCTIDAATGAITFTSGAYGSYSVTDAGGGWWKLTATFTPQSSGTATIQIRLHNASNTITSSYLGDGVSGMYVAAPYLSALTYVPSEPSYTNSGAGSVVGNNVKGTYAWGAMSQVGAALTSYIPTEAAAASRAADLLTANPTGFRKNFNRGNFAPSSSGIKLTTAQKRLVLQLRYFQLVTRGAIPEINRFLNYVFADLGKVYVLDGLDMTINYVFTFLPPSQLRFVLESFDVLPRPAAVGVNYVVTVRETFGFGPFHTNFNRGNFGSN